MGKEKSGKEKSGKEKSSSSKNKGSSATASKSSKTGDKKSSKSSSASKSKSSDSKSVATKKSSSNSSKSKEEKSKSAKGQQQQAAAAAKQIKQVKGKGKGKDEEEPADPPKKPPPPPPPPPPAKAKAKPKEDSDDENGSTSEMDDDSASQDGAAGQSSSRPGAEDSEWEGSEDGSEVEEEKPPKESELTFTKPTINQMKKDHKKEKPLSMSEKITGREFESLNDDIADLNSSIAMLRHSYGSIIKSLVAMQDRRTKKKAAKEAAQNQLTFLTTMSTANQDALKTKSCMEMTDKYDIERFLNPVTRDETFNALFDEVQELNGRTEPLRANCYDAKGRFLRDKYDALPEAKLDRAMYNEFKMWTKKLAQVVDDIARNYNDDLLNMFRLT